LGDGTKDHSCPNLEQTTGGFGFRHSSITRGRNMGEGFVKLSNYFPSIREQQLRRHKATTYNKLMLAERRHDSQKGASLQGILRGLPRNLTLQVFF